MSLTTRKKFCEDRMRGEMQKFFHKINRSKHILGMTVVNAIS